MDPIILDKGDKRGICMFNKIRPVFEGGNPGRFRQKDWRIRQAVWRKKSKTFVGQVMTGRGFLFLGDIKSVMINGKGGQLVKSLQTINFLTKSSINSRGVRWKGQGF